MQHVDDGRLHAWLDGGLTEADAAAVAAHLDACGACRARLDEERTLRDRAAALLAIDEPAIDRPPFDVLAARARGGAGSVDAADRVGMDQGGRRVWRRWLPPVGWAASVLFALAIGWMARDFIQPADAPSQVMASAARSEAAAVDPAERDTFRAAGPEAQSESARSAPASAEQGAVVDSVAATGERRAAEGRFEQAAGAPRERAREAPEPAQVSAAAPPSLPAPASVAPPPAAAPPPPPPPSELPASVPDAAAVEQESQSARDAASAVESPLFSGRGGRGGGGGGGGRGRTAAEPEPAPAPPRAQSVVEPAREPVAGLGQLELGLTAGQQGQALGFGFVAANWQVVGRTEAAARAGMALYGIPGMEPAQTAIGPGDRQVRTRYLLESGAILDLIQEREPSLAFARRDEIVAQPSTGNTAASNPRVWVARRDDVRVTLQTDATDVNLEALAGRLMID